MISTSQFVSVGPEPKSLVGKTTPEPKPISCGLRLSERVSVSKQSNNFDGLRLIGALMVLFSHQFAVMGRWEPRFIGDHSFGNLGVLIFFSISGYLISSSWVGDPNIKRFLVRRMLRIWPAYVVVIVLSSLIIPMVFDVSHVWFRISLYLKNIIFMGRDTAFFLSNPCKGMNGPLWTLRIEIQCYLLLMGCALILGKYFKMIISIAAGIAMVLYVTVLGAQSGFDQAASSNHIQFLPYFGSFFLVGVLAKHHPFLRAWKSVVVSITVGITLGVVGQTLLCLLFCVPLTVIMIGQNSWPIMRSFGKFGDMSYGVYIWAWPIQQCVFGLSRGTSYPALLSVSATLAVFAAFCSWHLVEKPCLRLKPKTPVLMKPRAVELAA